MFKEAGGNIVQVANPIKDVLSGDLEDLLGSKVSVALVEDQAAFIESSVTNLRDTAVIGGFFAILILFLFLRDFRSTVIIGLSIPVSVVCVFVPLSLLGLTLNLMSLGGLALGIGMLVDNAVVVLESIHRYREEGKSSSEAAVFGVSDVAGAVTASTLTTIAVFFPISFVSGVAGELFGDLAVAVIAALTASLIVALFLVPTLAAIEWGQGDEREEYGALNQQLFEYYGGDGRDQRYWSFAKSVLLGVWRRPTAELIESWAWYRSRLRRKNCFSLYKSALSGTARR